MQLPPSISVLDLGANCGGFSLMLLTMGYTLDKLLAVEMNPRTFSRLQFNLYHNISPLPTAINCAITGKEQICQIDDISGDTGQSIFENTTDTLISVPGTTIDAIISHHFPDSRINLCKIDIEGAEYDVVEKMNYKLLTKCDYIIIEIHKNSKYGISYIKDALISLGFIEQFIDAQTHSDVFCFENTFKTNS
ncbi:MAG: FkbM family methyltransferase [Chthoniobacterales bacterium]